VSEYEQAAEELQPTASRAERNVKERKPKRGLSGCAANEGVIFHAAAAHKA